MQQFYRALCIAVFVLISAVQVNAADWSNNEIHFQYGGLKNPFTDSSDSTTVVTLQHASGWKYGDNFFFIDFIDDGNGDSFNDKDYYGEFYGNLSLGKISERDLQYGILKDVGILMGVNAAGDSNVLKYLPGVRLSWGIEGFRFLNTDFTAYLDDSNSPLREDDSFMVDVNWAFPFEIGDQQFSLEGHIEYIGERDFQSGEGTSKWHIFTQPQLRWDIGHALADKAGSVFVGIEYQYWKNKLGTSVNESTVQALLVFVL